MIKHKHFLEKGFTLVELIIVIVVLSILASILIINYDGYLDRADQTQISTTADAYTKSIKAYALEFGAFPQVSTCLPANAKCCTSNAVDIPAVYCAKNSELGGIHNWATDNTDVKLTKYVNSNTPKFPVVQGFTDCVSGFMDNVGPCKPTSSIPVVGPAYISNVTGSKYTSNEPTTKGKGFLVYYVSPTLDCGSKDVMTLVAGPTLVFNSSAKYTRQTSAYRECIIGIVNS